MTELLGKEISQEQIDSSIVDWEENKGPFVDGMVIAIRRFTTELVMPNTSIKSGGIVSVNSFSWREKEGSDRKNYLTIMKGLNTDQRKTVESIGYRIVSGLLA